jgi:hypothetical protein
MATDSRQVEWPPRAKHSILIRLTLLWQQVRILIHGPDRFSSGRAFVFRAVE